MTAIDTIDLEIRHLREISTESMWSSHDGHLFTSDRVGAVDSFYPIYRHADTYVYSILPLLAHKGTFRLNRAFVERYLDGRGDVAGPDMTIDADITRLGGPPRLLPQQSSRTAFVEAMATAMTEDVREACARNPGKTPVVLCGGKDSLNLLLIDWPVPVIVYSAEPNYPLVARFVEDNGLDMAVRRLDDPEPTARALDREIAEAACLVDLALWKWTAQLRLIAEEMNHEVVFWKGQMADLLMTDYWRSYTSRPDSGYKFLRKLYKRGARDAPALFDGLFLSHALHDLERSIWRRVGVAQGGHLGFLRSICDALFLSAYHGPRTTAVLHAMNLPALTRDGDLRPEIGRRLLGRDVIYPATNPAPPSSPFRQNLRGVETFTAALSRLGIGTGT
jgi:hypothetical protein